VREIARHLRFGHLTISTNNRTHVSRSTMQHIRSDAVSCFWCCLFKDVLDWVFYILRPYLHFSFSFSVGNTSISLKGFLWHAHAIFHSLVSQHILRQPILPLPIILRCGTRFRESVLDTSCLRFFTIDPDDMAYCVSGSMSLSMTLVVFILWITFKLTLF